MRVLREDMLDDAVTNDQSQPPVWNVGTPIALASLNAGSESIGNGRYSRSAASRW